MVPELKLRALAATVALALFGSAHADAPMVKTQAPGFHRLMVGDFEVTALSDGTTLLPVDKILTHTTPAKVAAAFRKAGQALPAETSFNGYLVNTGAKLVLIDTGAAGLFGPTLGNLLANLKAAGYRPEQVDEVYITHMHPDHVGGLMAGEQRAFPNAVVRADQKDVDYWLSKKNFAAAPESAKGFFQGAMASINPYIEAGRFQPFDGDTELVPGVRAHASRGHTAGHSSYIVESRGDKLVLWGDLMHVAAVQFADPAVTIQFDTDPKAAAAQRRAAYADAAKNGYLVAGAHLSFPGIGRVRAEGKGYVDAAQLQRHEVNAAAQFVALFGAALADGSFTRLVLSKHEGAAEPDLQRLTVRRVTLAGRAQLGFVYRHSTRDVTKNHADADAIERVQGLLGSAFKHAHLHTTAEEVQLRFSKKGKATLLRGKAAAPQEPAAATPAPHDREKHRLVDITRPFLAALGVTDDRGHLVPAMARKWRQINKFVEVFAHAYAGSKLATQAGPLRVLDFGSGKGYLTFALHDHLRGALGREAQVTGVELRDDMVQLCNAAAQRLQLDGLRFEHGDVREHAAGAIDVMIALHACDTATDVALHRGIRSHAAIIMCSPCCHKELRPQLRSPALLRPMLRHGIHLGQQAEMVTDSLRALLLEAHGYDTQVFEFVALEHTSKNKMILAVRRDVQATTPAPDLWQQFRDVKAFYGVHTHSLELLLRADAEPA